MGEGDYSWVRVFKKGSATELSSRKENVCRFGL